MSTLRYWAAAKAEAGTAEQVLPATTLDELLTVARADKSARFATVLARCSYVVDGAPVGGRDHRTVVLGEASVVDALPPFAGG